jgi:uncharacterized repeat protein (TIGR01451 family)
MKTRAFEHSWKIVLAISVMVLAAAGLMLAAPVMAADNIGTGDIGGDGASLNDSNTFSLFSTTMSLNKMAFLTDGTQLTSGATLPRGTEVRFVIYIDNTTVFPLTDVSVQDVLDPAFAYQAGSMFVDNTAATGATPSQIYTAVSGGTAMSDPVDADAASAVGVTITAGTTGGNGQVDVAGNSVWAILFNALMQ